MILYIQIIDFRKINKYIIIYTDKKNPTALLLFPLMFRSLKIISFHLSIRRICHCQFENTEYHPYTHTLSHTVNSVQSSLIDEYVALLDLPFFD